MSDIRVNEDTPFLFGRMPRMEQNSEEYRTEPAKNESENESNDEDYVRSPVLLDLDENSKQQHQKVSEANSPNSAPVMNQQNQGLASEEMTQPQPIRDRWRETNFETRGQQNPEGVLVIRVPEPEIIGSHPHIEMLHEANIKSVQREPSQTEKGAAMSNCTSPGEITSTIEVIYMS